MAELIYAQILDEGSGLYFKVDAATGEVLKKKTTPGPYKDIPMYEAKREEEEEEMAVEELPPITAAEVQVAPTVVEEEKEEEIPQRKKISIDDSIASIVSLNEQGVDLFFDDTPGQFVKLPKDAVDALSKENRDRYILAAYYNERLTREKEHPEEFKTPGLSVMDALSARAQLAVEGKKPGMWYCWKRPKELPAIERLGYRVARHKGLKTMAEQEGDKPHRVSQFGDDELVLTMVEKETHDAVIKHHSDKSRKRAQTIEKSGAAEIRQSGGFPFKPKKGDGRNWSPSEGPSLRDE